MSLFVDIQKSLGDFELNVRFETDGSVLGILGASGCGKSMTLKCIAGIEKPDSGRIVLDGVTLFDSQKGINLPVQKRRVGYLFQSYALFPNMTVRQNILTGLNGEKNKTKKEEKLKSLMELFQLEDVENHKPSQLSGGQAQRTALARILASNPKLLMLDEPFSALDSHLRMQLQWQMRSLLASYGRDVLFVTHSRDEAYHLCSDIAVIDRGRIIGKKPTKAMFADPGSVCAARITGCKNVIPARKTGEYEVEVPDWGIRLLTAQPVGEGLKAIGVRAHYFSVNEERNCFPVIFKADMEEPFEWIVAFRYEGQRKDAPDIWWRLSKDARPAEHPVKLGIAPEHILLLYK